MDSSKELIDLLNRCTLPLSILDEKSAKAELSGTGFFVAPGLILTCTHVVKKAHQSDGFSVKAEWEGKPYTLKIHCLLPDPPDLALLKLENAPSAHPCVFLHEAVLPDDDVYSYGYPKSYPNGDPSTFVIEGMSDSPRLIKLKLGEARQGFSGAPLLNHRIGGVCGVIKLTRGENTLMGGRAIPTDVVLERFPELVAEQEKFHQKDSRWHDWRSPQQYREQIDVVKRIMKKVSELKTVHHMLHEVEAALAPFNKQISLLKYTKLQRGVFESIESESGKVWRRIKDLRLFAERDMKCLLELAEEERFTVRNGDISGPFWITNLLILQTAFEAGLKERNRKELVDISDDLLSSCRTHLQKIDDRLFIAVNQLNRLSD